MKRYRIRLEDHTYDVEVLDNPRQDQVRVSVDGETFVVGVETVTAVGSEEAVPTVVSSPVAPAPKLSVSGDRTVVAPLPGVIKSIAVRAGQEVSPDDELIVIEAMKMDNLIRATRVGTIATVHVSEGRQVTHGEPLLDYAA
jgi:biotin carboxyl carrier protein